MKKLILDAPAKINLYLKILGKRPDGYHQVETIIQAIDLCDRLILEQTKKGIKLSSNNNILPLSADNLVYKAAELLIRTLNIKKGIHVFIEKNIPIAAGLGGGSSDAASAILGLNQLWDLNLNQAKLINFAKKIGTDVPFFISGYQTALATGRGDELLPIETKMRQWYCLVVPSKRLLSRRIYGEVGQKDLNPILSTYKGTLRAGKGGVNLTFSSADVKMLTRALTEGYKGKIEKFLYNGLAKIVIKLAPEVDEIIQLMKSAGLKGFVSGSGPAVYTPVPNRKEATRIAKEFSSRHGWSTHITQTYDRRM